MKKHQMTIKKVLLDSGVYIGFHKMGQIVACQLCLHKGGHTMFPYDEKNFLPEEAMADSS